MTNYIKLVYKIIVEEYDLFDFLVYLAVVVVIIATTTIIFDMLRTLN
jgi:hypothetical protein